MEIKVPALGESISEATLAAWLKSEGDFVEEDEPIAELETDKITIEVNAPSQGRLSKLMAKEGAVVEVGAVLGSIVEGAEAAEKKQAHKDSSFVEKEKPKEEEFRNTTAPASPAAKKLAGNKSISLEDVRGHGRGGRITKQDVLSHKKGSSSASRANDDRQERVPMSRLRQKIAERLKGAQNTAAILTTFNEVDMSAVMGLRKKYKESFEKRYGVKLGFMSFFTKAAVAALRELPEVNAEISGDEIIYKNYYNIGVAVGTEQGLVVPVIKDADELNFAELEKTVADFGARARAGKLTIEDLMGGTFTISNGGVYGSLMSTPILNPPQSGILGLHSIQKRPVVVGDEIKIRPMMYMALSYDHRIVDGKEAVTFLVRIKEFMEDPARLMLEL